MWKQIKVAILPTAIALIVGITIGFGALGTTHIVQGQSATDPEAQIFRDLYTHINPSVVSLNVRGPTTDQFGNASYEYAAGSGFIYDTKGHIVTNAHVVLSSTGQTVDQIEIIFSDNTQLYGKLVGLDVDSDIAVIQAQGDTSKYPPLPLADSNSVQAGDRVIAIGNPFGISGTMTQGIVSGVGRSVQGLNVYSIPDAIQTDAAINPGNSGGPLVNEAGQVIGINEQIASQVRQSSGVSFAIPSDIVKQAADALIQTGKIQHTYLGIAGTTTSLLTNNAMNVPAETHGALITGIRPNSPAAAAGLRGGSTDITDEQGQNITVGGDIITAVNGQPIARYEDLTTYLFTKTTVGQTVTLTILRNGQQQQVQVKLVARPAQLSQSQGG